MPTPHINANKDQIAKTVLMPGDPLRAKFIAENYLKDAFCFNTIRNMFGYTGMFNGKQVSIMSSGMGVPSMGIYSYELFNFYDVDNIIRIGSAGAVSKNVNLKDVIVAMGVSTTSNYASQYKLCGTFAPLASIELLLKAVEVAKSKQINIKIGNVLCTDTFYDDVPMLEDWQKMGVLAVEMESAALYMNAARASKNALCIVTISDCPITTKQAMTANERETSFNQMVELALNII